MQPLVVDELHHPKPPPSTGWLNHGQPVHASHLSSRGAVGARTRELCLGKASWFISRIIDGVRHIIEQNPPGEQLAALQSQYQRPGCATWSRGPNKDIHFPACGKDRIQLILYRVCIPTRLLLPETNFLAGIHEQSGSTRVSQFSVDTGQQYRDALSAQLGRKPTAHFFGATRG